jgi:hypothetical protein
MIRRPQDQERREPASDETTPTRRGMIKNQAKVVLALGTALLTANMAKAAPRPPCFLRGTKLRTADGERNVEDIAVGDLLLTAFGQSRAVQWVGRWHVRKRTGEPWSKDLRPVRIRQSALGPNTPYTDLYVTQGHAMFIDGVLIPAGQLINGASITLDDAEEADELEYFHVKLASHDVIFAAGAPSETLLKYPNATGDLVSPAPKRGAVENEMHCAPILCNGNRSVIAVRVRSLATAWLGPQKLDVIRTRLQHQARSIDF